MSEESKSSRTSLVQFGLSLGSKFLDLLAPYAPQLVPFAVCFVFIPLVLFLSITTGWLVWSNVAVGWEAPLFLQYGDGLPPYAQIHLPALVAQQPYDINIHLLAPATEANFALGNFMTSLTLTNSRNKTLLSVRRPSIALRPRSSYFFQSSNLVEITVPLLSAYVPGTSFVNAFVELGRKDTWKTVGSGEGRELSVYAASLRGTVSHQGIRGLVTRFPLISSVASAGLFFVILVFILGACVLPVILRGKSDESSLKLSGIEAPVKEEKSDETPVVKKRLSRSSRSGSRRRSIKAEDEGYTEIPPASPSGNPLRRRRSRALSDDLSDDA